MPRRDKLEIENEPDEKILNQDFDLYTINQVANLLGRHKETVLRYIRENKLSARKAADRWLVHKTDLDKFLGLTKKTTKKK